MISPAWVALSLVLLVAMVGSTVEPVPNAAGPLTITPVTPQPGAQVNTGTPTISAQFTDTASTVRVDTVQVLVDGNDVTGLDTTTITAGGVTYVVPSILQLSNGNHTVSISAQDAAGNRAMNSWGFVVNTSAVAPSPLSGVRPLTLLLEIALGVLVSAAAFGGYIFYLKQTRRFTFQKYFLRHPVKRQYLVLYLPAAVAFIFVLVALIYVYNTPGLPALAPDYALVGGLFVGLTFFALDSRRQKQKIRMYERAFAQFLFEMADAMRGGIDPAKAVVELSKTHTNVLKRPLRIAADAIRLGRPFDQVLKDMVAGMKSPLVTRYAGLISDASAVGGETSAVVYQAAKDMDDFIKIEVERNKQLTLPVAVVYIAWGVLMATLFALLNILPSLGSINISIFGSSTNLAAGTSGSTVPRLAFNVLRERFFDLMIINSLGAGVIIGAFTEGKARYGLLHSLALSAATVVAFALIFP